VEETAEALQVSPQSVMRDWKLATAWLTHSSRSNKQTFGGGLFRLEGTSTTPV